MTDVREQGSTQATGTAGQDTSVSKTIQIRSTAEMSAWLSEYCRQHGMTAGEALAEMRQAVSEHDTALNAPEMEKQVSDYRAYRTMMDTLYLSAIQGQHDAEAKARTAVQDQLNALGKSLAQEQEKSARAESAAKEAEAARKDAENAKDAAEKKAQEISVQAERDVHAANDARKKAEETAAAKTQLADTLSEDLAEYKKKASAYDELNGKYLQAEDARKAAEQAVKDAKRDAAEAAREAQRAAEKAQEQALKAQAEEDRKIIESLQDQLHAAKSETAVAQEQAKAAQEQAARDAEAAKAQLEADRDRIQAQAELAAAQKYTDQIEDLRRKLDARTEEILRFQRQ